MVRVILATTSNVMVPAAGMLVPHTPPPSITLTHTICTRGRKSKPPDPLSPAVSGLEPRRLGAESELGIFLLLFDIIDIFVVKNVSCDPFFVLPRRMRRVGRASPRLWWTVPATEMPPTATTWPVTTAAWSEARRAAETTRCCWSTSVSVA